MQAICIINIYSKCIEKINTRLIDKIIVINLPAICIINMYAKIINENYDYLILYFQFILALWGKKVCCLTIWT